MRLPDEGSDPDRISPIFVAILFVAAIVVMVLWMNKESLVKPNNTPVKENAQQTQEPEIPIQGTLTPDDLDFWDKYPAPTEVPPDVTPLPTETPDPSTDGKHFAITNEEGKEEWLEINDALQKHKYDFSKLAYKSGLLSYYKDGNEVSYAGVDISKHQEEVDFAKVKAAGFDFCMLRVGARGYSSGQLVLDDYFLENIEKATEARLDIGVYFFSQAVTEEEAIEEAEMVLEQIKEFEVNYPIAFDMEYVDNDTSRVEQLTKKQKTKIAKAFLETIEEAGYTPMIYGKKEWLVQKLNLVLLEEYDVWLAEYAKVPAYPYAFTMWQYSNQGKVDGIEGKVNLNISFIDYSEK